jgi:hypothetical protein
MNWAKMNLFEADDEPQQMSETILECADQMNSAIPSAEDSPSTCKLRRQIALRKKRSFSLVPTDLKGASIETAEDGEEMLEEGKTLGENGEKQQKQRNNHLMINQRMGGGHLDETIAFLRNYKKVQLKIGLKYIQNCIGATN